MKKEQSDLQLESDLRTVITRLIKKLRTKSATGARLSLTERSTLSLLDQHKELLPNELASMEKITTQSMSQILGHLFKLGYINRRVSEKDKRKAIISLSDAGQDFMYTVRNERDEWLHNAIKKTFSAEDQDLLRRALVPLARLVEFD